jgi:hypothetical protein
MMPLPEQGLGLILRSSNLTSTLGLHDDDINRIGIRGLDADHLPLRRRDRKQDDVVLILPRGRLALRSQHADHTERYVLDADRLSYRVHASKHVIDHCFAEQGDLVGSVDVLLRAFKLPVAVTLA